MPVHPQIAVRILPFEKKLADALNQLVENGSLAADLKPYQLVSDRHEGLPTMLCVCQSTREVVGGASFVMPEYEAQKVIEILTLYVDQGHRRQGIAESMIREIGAYAKQNSIANLYGITDTRFAGASELYSKCGFAVELEGTYMVLRKALTLSP
ncbi:MAG: GNAT family N-acetyltransferase [Bacteroidota bacterium]